MQADEIEQLARQMIRGELSPTELMRRLTQAQPSAATATMAGPQTIDLCEVQLDVDRPRRCGYPEVVYAEGKSVATLEKVLAALSSGDREALATRVNAEQAAALAARFPAARYNALARTLRVPGAGAASSGATAGLSSSAPSIARIRRGCVAVISAGTSDLPVAEEARETAEWTGADVNLIHDVGVAGPHRLRERYDEFSAADAIVVVAGMEGALPSVVAGYVSAPVIAVPTSVGYGASFGGLAALLSMLNSCAANVCVVNIDAGFKAGYLAGLIAGRTARSGNE